MQLFSADPTIFLKKLQKIFCPQKVEKTTLKSCSEKLKSTFFSLLPWAAQTEEFMFQIIDQLYIELGVRLSRRYFSAEGN